MGSILGVQPTAVLDNHRGTLRRPQGARNPRQLAACAGIQVARAYWPCLLKWVEGDPTGAALAHMRHETRRRDRMCLLVSVSPRVQILLLPEDQLEPASRAGFDSALSALLEIARVDVPEPRIQAVVGHRMDAGESLASTMRHLSRVGHYAFARGGGGVAWAPGYSFGCLLDTLDAEQAQTFVQGQLARVAAYDRENGTDLQRVLELALDCDNRNDAAHAAFMHRNTFRRRLRTALDLVDANLERPEERLALHLALKLRARHR